MLVLVLEFSKGFIDAFDVQDDVLSSTDRVGRVASTRRRGGIASKRKRPWGRSLKTEE